VLVGPSGSGKTTAMRLINRLIRLSGGDILLGGRSVLERNEVALRRDIGYVIQQVGLFPHMTVARTSRPCPGCWAGSARESRSARASSSS